MSLLSRVKDEAKKPRGSLVKDRGLSLAYIDSEGFRWYETQHQTARGLVTFCTREDALDEPFIDFGVSSPEGRLIIVEGWRDGEGDSSDDQEAP